VAFTVSAGVFGLGVILAIVPLPSKHRLDELRSAAATPTPAPEALVPVPVPVPAAAAAYPGMHAIPVALCSCSPVIIPAARPGARPSL
jgi:hypothetical protein